MAETKRQDVEVKTDAQKITELEELVIKKGEEIAKLQKANEDLHKELLRYQGSATSAKMLLHDFIDKL